MTLQDAIYRSVSHTEIVACDFSDGDEADLVAELVAICGGEVDSARENDGTIDVWGGADEMTWRLKVTLA